jgi:hypothetical protein
MRIRIQHFSSFKKITAGKLFFFISKIALDLSLGLYKGDTSYKRSLQTSKRTSRSSKHKNSSFFLYLWFIFALLAPDPDPATQFNADPDPQPWNFPDLL